MASVALIGVGGFGGFHLKCLRTLQEEGLARLVAVADPHRDALADTHAQLSAEGVRWHQDLLTLLAKEDQLDLIIIATPIPLHEQMVREVLARTDVAILLEKPPVPTLEQLHGLIRADPHTRVHVGFQMVSYPSIRQLQKWMKEGRFGRVRRITAGAVWPRGDRYYGRSNWAGRMLTDNGEPVFDGPATNALAHLAHNIMFLGGDGAGIFSRPAEVEGEFYRARSIESYDAACLTGRLDSGIDYALAVAHCSRDLRNFSVRVEGDAGHAEVDDNGKGLHSSFAPSRYFEEPQTANFHRETLLRVMDRRPPLTSLGDCLGYSEVTCGGFLSSGRIHDIPAHYVDAGQTGPDRIYHVEGMAEAVERSIETGQPWNAQMTPWTQERPEIVSAAALASGTFGARNFTNGNGHRPVAPALAAKRSNTSW